MMINVMVLFIYHTCYMCFFSCQRKISKWRYNWRHCQKDTHGWTRQWHPP